MCLCAQILISSYPHILLPSYPHIPISSYPHILILLVANASALHGMRRGKAHLLVPWLFVYLIGIGRLVYTIVQLYNVSKP